MGLENKALLHLVYRGLITRETIISEMSLAHDGTIRTFSSYLTENTEYFQQNGQRANYVWGNNTYLL